MTVQTSCQHCGNQIEFQAENANELAPCPSCGRQTRLLLGKPTEPQNRPVSRLSKNTKKALAILFLGAVAAWIAVFPMVVCNLCDEIPDNRVGIGLAVVNLLTVVAAWKLVGKYCK